MEQAAAIRSDPVEDAVLLAAARGGSAEAFEALFRRYYDMIYGYAYRMGLDSAEAADAAQETWIKAARNLAGYGGRASFKNWLYAIAHNAVTDALRRSVRDTRMKEAAASSLPEADASHFPDEALHAAMASLPVEQRESVVLVYMEGRSHSDAGRILGCAEATISWRLFRARRRLKQLLLADFAGGGR